MRDRVTIARKAAPDGSAGDDAVAGIALWATVSDAVEALNSDGDSNDLVRLVDPSGCVYAFAWLEYIAVRDMETYIKAKRSNDHSLLIHQDMCPKSLWVDHTLELETGFRAIPLPDLLLGYCKSTRIYWL